MIEGCWETNTVTINGSALPLDRSLKLRNHSPTGFSWGYGGSGPSQLALAILLAFTDKVTAIAFYQDLKWEIIAGLPQEDFSLDRSVILKWLEEKSQS